MIIKLILKSYFMICIIFGAETECGYTNTNILRVLDACTIGSIFKTLGSHG